jgi:nicotinamide-nucleotide adenylyltransferase
VKEISKNFGEIVIVIGSAQYHHEKRNPFTLDEREKMIRIVLKDDLNYSLVPMDDVNDDYRWIELVKKSVPNFDVVFSNNDLSRKLFSEAGHKVSNTGIVNFDGSPISGERIRELIAGDDEKWIKMVPEEVYKKILEIDGVNKIRKLFEE